VNARRTSRQQPPDTRPLEPSAGIRHPARDRVLIGERLALVTGHRDAPSAAPRSCGRSVPSPISDEANRDLLRTTAPGADCPGTRAGESSSRAIPSPLPPTERPSSPSAARRSSPHGDHSIAFRPTTGCCGCNPRHLPLYLRLQPDIVLSQSLGYPRNAELDFRSVPGPETNRRVTISQ